MKNLFLKNVLFLTVVLLMMPSGKLLAQETDYEQLKKQMQQDAQKIEASQDKKLWEKSGGWISLGVLAAAGAGVWNLYRASRGPAAGVAQIAQETAQKGSAASAKMVEQVFDVAAYTEKYNYQVSNLYRHYQVLPDGTSDKGLLYRVRPGQEENFIKAVHKIVLEELDKLPATMKEMVLKGDTQFLQRRLALNTKIKERICTSLRDESLTYFVVPVQEGGKRFIARRTLGSVGRQGIRLLPVVAFALVLGQPANAQEEDMARRIEDNWSLAWTACGKEADLIASSERLMTLCRSIAGQLHELAQIPPALLQEQLEMSAKEQTLVQATVAEELKHISVR